MYDARPTPGARDEGIELVPGHESGLKGPVEQAERVDAIELERRIDHTLLRRAQAQAIDLNDLVQPHWPLTNDDLRAVDRGPRKGSSGNCEATRWPRRSANDGDVHFVFLEGKPLSTVCTRGGPADEARLAPVGEKRSTPP